MAASFSRILMDGEGCVLSRPFLLVDMIWNLAFVLVSVLVLLVTVEESPSTPLRVWVFGYALQCLVHVAFVWDDYQRWSLVIDGDAQEQDQGAHALSFCHNSITKKLESLNTILSSVWWVVGFYWIIVGGHLHSPRLYWLSVVFLAFDVFLMIFCIVMACIIFFLLFCCFPIISMMTTGKTGASENDIRSLSKYLYRQTGNEDSECCICLYKYVDGAEICSLPCNHHFHHKCITKWLRINAMCPLCKFNIFRGEMLV